MITFFGWCGGVLTEIVVSVAGAVRAQGVENWNHLLSLRESAHWKKKREKEKKEIGLKWLTMA